MTLREQDLYDGLGLTPGEHRAAADRNMAAIRSLPAGSAAYSALAQSAIAHLLAAILACIDPDDVDAAEMRLPGRVTVRARQSPAGARQWRYVIVPPDGRPGRVSDYRYTSAGAALRAGAGAAGNGRETGEEAGSD